MNSFLSHLFKKQPEIAKIDQMEIEKSYSEQLQEINMKLSHLGEKQIKGTISNEEIIVIPNLLLEKEKLESKLGILKD